ncbi:MAG: oxidoreductase [Alphaproteobacteria bacterium]|nr:oxidoreductase [Alphaproteobacteria bacterium]
MSEIELTPEERQPCEVWTRIMGYHRPISQANKGKQQEHRDRKYYAEPMPQTVEIAAE